MGYFLMNAASDYRSLSPYAAWLPLPHTAWTLETAAHLLRRLGWTATPEATAAAYRAGPRTTIRKLFGTKPAFDIPQSTMEADDKAQEMFREARQDGMTPEERRRMLGRARRLGREAFRQFGQAWFRHARQEDNAAYEKFVMFLSDIFVVGYPKVRSPEALAMHQVLLRDHFHSDYATLCKAVSRSPAMVQYLDLRQSRAGKPNENFARELFELFMLGEGNYTEQDIKEAARAFTGYKSNSERFYFVERQFDDGEKTVFGKTGNFTGDDIIDLTMEQPAAARFLPRELARFYLSNDVDLPDAYIQPIATQWREDGFQIDLLVEKFFSSTLFYHPQFRGNMIKSPTQFYLGLLQDLRLHPTPVSGAVDRFMQSMGQPFFQPPNVRGWVYGQPWINSSTVQARRAVVEAAFRPVNVDKLNADDRFEYDVAVANGEGEIFVREERLKTFADSRSDEELVDFLIQYMLATEVPEAFRETLVSYLASNDGSRLDRVEKVTMTILQTPQYNLC